MRFYVAILAALALLTGCGGGDDGSSKADDRSSGSGYSVELPEGWSDATDKPEVAESPIRVDRFFAKKPRNQFATNVNVIRQRVPAGLGLDELARQSVSVLKGFGARDLTAPQDRQLKGEAAVSREYNQVLSTRMLRGHQVFSIHEGRVYYATFTAPSDTFEPEQKEFEQILDSWQWE